MRIYKKEMVLLTSSKSSQEGGFVYVMFVFLFPVLLLLIGLVIDTANIYSASLKANAAAEAGVTSAIVARIHEKDPVILESFNALSESGQADGTANENEKKYLTTRTIDSIRNNLVSNGILIDKSLVTVPTNIGNSNRAAEILDIKSDVQGDLVSGEVHLLVPTLLLHYVYGNQNLIQRKNSTVVVGTAKALLKGGNYLFVIDLSDSQACPAGVVKSLDGSGNIVEESYCRCNSVNKNIKADGTPETCKEEADRVVGELNGKIRAELTRESLINAISRLDSKRDRISVIGFNSVAFPIITFKDKVMDPASGILKAKKGFDLNFIRDRLRQIKPMHEAVADFAAGKPLIVGGQWDYDRVPVIVPEGNTNISDAFLTAYEEAKHSGLTIDEGERFNIVYYSDGAATAMRGSFDGVVSPSFNRRNQRTRPPRTFSAAFNDNQIDKNSYPQMNFESNLWANDLISYQVVLGDGKGNFILSMGPLVDASLYKRWYLWNLLKQENATHFGHNLPFVPRAVTDPVETRDDRKNFGPYLLPDCHCGNASTGYVSCNNIDDYNDPALWKKNKPYIYNKDLFDLETQKRREAFQMCFNSGTLESSFASKSDKHSLGSKINVAEMFDSGKDFRYLYYMAALEAAELVRESGGRIHSIGYGKEAGNLDDPVQGLGDVAGMKAALMANYASAFDDLKALYPDKGDLEKIPQFGKDIYPGYESLKTRKDGGMSGGAFYKTPDPAQFENFLNLLLIQIRMSLVEVN